MQIKEGTMFYTVVVLFFFAVGEVLSAANSCCLPKEKSNFYLNIALDAIEKIKAVVNSSSSCVDTCNSVNRYVDCSDVLKGGSSKSGVYTISPMHRLVENKSLKVYCDMTTDGGGWTLIQRRGDYGKQEDYFYKDWKSYKDGFGDVVEDFWLGNDNIFALTNQKLYSVRFDLEDFEGNKKYALYDTFWIDDELQKYTLHIAGYKGDAGDAMITRHDNQKFTTKDQQNDKASSESCAVTYKGAWWYSACHDANLNGLYVGNKLSDKGVIWSKWKGYNGSLKSAEIKIRPKNFRQSEISHLTPLQ